MRCVQIWAQLRNLRMYCAQNWQSQRIFCRNYLPWERFLWPQRKKLLAARHQVVGQLRFSLNFLQTVTKRYLLREKAFFKDLFCAKKPFFMSKGNISKRHQQRDYHKHMLRRQLRNICFEISGPIGTPMPGIQIISIQYSNNPNTNIGTLCSNRLLESKVTACAASPLSLQTTLVRFSLATPVIFFLARRECNEQRAERARALARRRVFVRLLSEQFQFRSQDK